MGGSLGSGDLSKVNYIPFVFAMYLCSYLMRQDTSMRHVEVILGFVVDLKSLFGPEGEGAACNQIQREIYYHSTSVPVHKFQSNSSISFRCHFQHTAP